MGSQSPQSLEDGEGAWTVPHGGNLQLVPQKEGPRRLDPGKDAVPTWTPREYLCSDSGHIGGDQCGQVKSISFLFWLLCEEDAQLLQSCLTLWDHMDPVSQAPLSTGFSRQGYWRGLTFPSPGNLPDPGLEPGSPAKWDRTFKSGIPLKKYKVPWYFLHSHICGKKIMLTMLLYGVFYNESFSSTHSQFKNKSQEKVISIPSKAGLVSLGCNTGTVFTPSSREFSAGKRAPKKKADLNASTSLGSNVSQ